MSPSIARETDYFTTLRTLKVEFRHRITHEIGNLLTRSASPCASGSGECWEVFASERSALVRYASLSGPSKGASLTSFGDLIDLALTGDELARTALRETGRFPGVGIVNLIRGLAPEAVIVTGRIVRALVADC